VAKTNPVEQLLDNKIVPVEIFYKKVLGIPDEDLLGYRTYLNVNSMDTGVLSPEDYRFVARRTVQCEQLADKNITKVMRTIHNDEKNLIRGIISVQIPGRMLKDGKLMEIVTSLLRRYPRASANRICLEFDSEIFFSDFDFIKSEIEKIKALGFKIGINEVGTEYFPLMKLQQMPVDVVFLDEQVNKNLNTEQEEKTAGSLVAFLLRLNVQVILMGLTQDKMRSAERLGCTGFCHIDYDGIFPPRIVTEEG
jgi:EAL domain-containing protein (putative c-di-GMP-specific phosphodiesterase class I)